MRYHSKKKKRKEFMEIKALKKGFSPNVRKEKM